MKVPFSSLVFNRYISYLLQSYTRTKTVAPKAVKHTNVHTKIVYLDLKQLGFVDRDGEEEDW